MIVSLSASHAALEPPYLSMKLTLLPLMGPFHLRYPLYNAVSVRDAVAAFQPHGVATTALAADALADPLWQDTPELVLPHTVVPWARRRGVPVYGVYRPSPDPAAATDFRRYAAQYPKLRDARAARGRRAPAAGRTSRAAPSP